ncbi:MAG: hypothetical protein HN776_05105, partial [Nitrosomonadales bacterium]|nr:hypothetical protein [Nitrosomonadales bacterium]
SMSITFVTIWLFSSLDKSKKSNDEIKKYDNQFFRSQTGIGIDAKISH